MNDISISARARRTLLALARESIELAYTGASVRAPDRFESVFEEKRGAFVTLKQSGRLRGCIGNVEPLSPLWQTVARVARAASFDDPRFPTLPRKELHDVTIEISVLSPPVPIDSPKDVQVGRHGLVVQRGERRGLLLPQVAVQWEWGPEEFVEQTCHKAGLEPDAWRHPDVFLFVFFAEVFGEDSP